MHISTKNVLAVAVFALFTLLQAFQGLCQETVSGAVLPGDNKVSFGLETAAKRSPYPPYLSGAAADKELYTAFVAVKDAVRGKDLEGARTRLKELVGKCSDLGITSCEALSAALIKEGRLLLDDNDVAGAMLLFDYAILISPNYPPAYFTKGWALLTQNRLKLLVAFDSFIEGISRSTVDFWWSYIYLGNKATSLLFALAALFTLFGLFIAVRYTPLLAHDLAEKFGRLESEQAIRYLWLPLFFILILLALDYWWAVTIVLVSLWFYFNKREKTVAVLFFLLLVFMPLVMTKYASFVQGGGNRMLWVLNEVNKGVIEPGAADFLKEAIEKEPDNQTAMMSLAQLYTKQRDYGKAVETYEKLVVMSPDNPLYRNNLGNVYFLTGEFEKAVQEYNAAIKYGPERVLPHFNLSQVYGEMLMFTERSNEDRSANRLDPDLVTMLRAKEGGTPLRMVFEEKLPVRNLWEIAFRTSSESRALAGSLWSTTIKVMPLEGASYAGAGFIVLVMALNAFRRNRVFAHFCAKCGKVSCKKCQKPVYSKELCSQCHQIFVKMDGVEARDRLKKTLEIREKETREGMLFRISSLLLPGSGHYLVGRPMRGFIFSGIFIFLVKDIFFGHFLDMPYAFSLNVIGPDTVLMAALLLVFYIVTQMDIYRITKK